MSEPPINMGGRLPDDLVERPAFFSQCGRYRYWLRRRIHDDLLATGQRRPCVWIMLNPSVADGETDDATTRIAVNYAHRWGYTDHVAVNLFALVNTDPAGLWEATDPIGPANDEAIRRAVDFAKEHRGLVVAAWGNHGQLRQRDREVLKQLKGVPMCVLGLTSSRRPRFPRAVGRSAVPMAWSEEAREDAL